MIFAPEDIKKILLESRRDLFSFYNEGDFASKYDKREKFRTGTSWHVPNQKLIDVLVSNGPIVSVGSGFAYTESIAISQGADIIATDVEPTKKNGWCRGGKFYCDVEKLKGDEAVKKYSDRNVFMAWPPYDNPMAYEVASSMEIGSTLIYIGEDHGGCTGDDQFFTLIYSNFEEVDSFEIPRWSGLNDYVFIYKKIK